MPKLPQFEEDIPIITTQPISSGAQGLEAISKSFGGISQTAIQEAKEIGKEQSNAMTLQTQAHADTIKTDAYTNMIKHPEMSDAIQQKAQEEYNTTLNQAVVNKADRAKLGYTFAHDMNEIKLKGAETAAKQVKVQGNIALMSTWPSTLERLRTSANDEKLFSTTLKTAQDSISTAFKSGIIDMPTFNRLNGTLLGVMKGHQAYLEQVGNPDVTAQDHNRIAHAGIVDDVGHHGLPQEQGTVHLADRNSQDITVKRIKSDIANGIAPNGVAYSYIKDERQLNEIQQFGVGANKVNADMRTGVPINVLENRLEELKKKTALSPQEEGEKSRLQNVIQEGVIGNFHNFISTNGVYQQYEADYNHNTAAIQNMAGMSDQEKSQKLQYFDNQFMHQQVSLARALHIKDEYINPIQPRLSQQAQLTFEKGGDPNLLKSTMAYVDQSSKEYLARSMQTPTQQEVARAVGNLQNTGVHDNDINALVLANSKDFKIAGLTEGQPNQAQTAVKYSVASKLSTSTGFVKSQVNGEKRIVAMIDMGTNLAYFFAAQNNDLSQPETYAQQAADVINKAYPVSQGTFWTKNDKDFPLLDKPQMDVLSQYLINHINDLASEKGYTQSRINNWNSSNTKSIIGTPTGDMVVVDSQRNILYTAPYSSNMLSAAYADQEKRLKEQEDTYKKIHSIVKSRLELPQSPIQQEEEKLKQPGIKAEASAESSLKPGDIKAEASAEVSTKKPVFDNKAEASAKLAPLKEQPLYPPHITQADIDKVNNLPKNIKSHINEYRNALKPFMNYDNKDTYIDHKHMTKEQLEDELNALRTGDFTRKKKR